VRQLPTNSPIAYETECFPIEFAPFKFFLKPFSFFHRYIGSYKMIGHCDHKRKGKFGNRDAGGFGSIIHDNTFSSCVFGINGIKPNTSSYNVSTTSCPIEHGSIDLCPGANYQHLGLSNPRHIRSNLAKFRKSLRQIRRKGICKQY